MKKKYSLPGIGLSIVFLISAFFFISKSSEASAAFKEEKGKIAEVLNFNDRLLSVREWIFTEKVWEEKKAEFEAVLEASNEYYAEAVTYGYYLLMSALALLFLLTLLYAKKRIYFGITLGLTVIGISLVGQGVMNPLMELSAFKEDLTIKVHLKPKDIPYFQEFQEYLSDADDLAGYIKLIPVYGSDWAKDTKSFVQTGESFLAEHENEEFGVEKVFKGRMYFVYQNKGMMDVIRVLWAADNRGIAILVGLFSVIIPLVKLFSTLFILIFGKGEMKLILKILEFIAKWSMVDVFVVAVFIAVLSFANMNPGVDMEASGLFGLYYFTGYVILSVFLGSLLKKSLKEKGID